MLCFMSYLYYCISIGGGRVLCCAALCHEQFGCILVDMVCFCFRVLIFIRIYYFMLIFSLFSFLPFSYICFNSVHNYSTLFIVIIIMLYFISPNWTEGMVEVDMFYKRRDMPCTEGSCIYNAS